MTASPTIPSKPNDKQGVRFELAPTAQRVGAFRLPKVASPLAPPQSAASIDDQGDPRQRLQAKHDEGKLSSG